MERYDVRPPVPTFEVINFDDSPANEPLPQTQINRKHALALALAIPPPTPKQTVFFP